MSIFSEEYFAHRLDLGLLCCVFVHVVVPEGGNCKSWSPQNIQEQICGDFSLNHPCVFQLPCMDSITIKNKFVVLSTLFSIGEVWQLALLQGNIWC
jgi:hypothetical protein